MGSPKISSTSTLSPFQQTIEGLLAGWFDAAGTPQIGQIGRLFNGGLSNRLDQRFGDQSFFEQGTADEFLQNLRNAPGRSQGALDSILSGEQQDTSQFERDLTTNAFRRFDRFVAPRISSQFGGLSSSLSSRRGETIGRAATDTGSQLNAQIGQLRTGIQENARNRQLTAIGIPLQQALGQIGGFNALRGGRLGEQNFFLNQRRQGFNEQLAPFQTALGFLGRNSQALSSTPSTGSQVAQGLGGLAGLFGGKNPSG